MNQIYLFVLDINLYTCRIHFDAIFFKSGRKEVVLKQSDFS
jgi:hypothetical protein